MRFKNKLQNLYLNLDIGYIPSGYKRLGTIMILRSKQRLTKKLGKIILKEYKWCESVYQQIDTIEERRKPILKFLAGKNDPIIIHKENGVKYKLDVSEITFSGGNSELRRRLVNDVSQDEFLVDMFAAVGNLSLQVVYYKGIKCLMIEKNNYTFSFLKETLELNGLAESVKIINDDCRNVTFNNIADRIFMGYHEIDETHIKKAIQLAKNNCKIHLHPLVKENEYKNKQEYFVNIFRNYNISVISAEINKIKSYAPKIDHIEIILTIKK